MTSAGYTAIFRYIFTPGNPMPLTVTCPRRRMPVAPGGMVGLGVGVSVGMGTVAVGMTDDEILHARMAKAERAESSLSLMK